MSVRVSLEQQLICPNSLMVNPSTDLNNLLAGDVTDLRLHSHSLLWEVRVSHAEIERKYHLEFYSIFNGNPKGLLNHCMRPKIRSHMPDGNIRY